MTILLLGLVIFLGIHSVRIVADPWRSAMRARLGEPAWKGLYTLVSLLGFGLIVWGFGQARQGPLYLWGPPQALRHLAGLLNAIVFILLAAAYVPRNHFKAKLGHPMLLAVKVWALAHLLANGGLHHMVLFGSFLLWSIFCFKSARQRDRLAGTVYPAGTALGGASAVAIGGFIWFLFAFWLHAMLIGVNPFA